MLFVLEGVYIGRVVNPDNSAFQVALNSPNLCR